MRYLLDTNVCVKFLNGDSERLRQRFLRTNRQDIVVCSVVKAELFYGAMRSDAPTSAWVRQRRFLEAFVSLPLDDFAALIAGRVRAQLANVGTPIGIHDLLIASIALANHLILVTHNTREFERVKDLEIEDWEVE